MYFDLWILLQRKTLLYTKSNVLLFFFKLNNDHPQITSNQFENSLYLNEYNILITIIYYLIYKFFC